MSVCIASLADIIKHMVCKMAALIQSHTRIQMWSVICYFNCRRNKTGQNLSQNTGTVWWNVHKKKWWSICGWINSKCVEDSLQHVQANHIIMPENMPMTMSSYGKTATLTLKNELKQLISVSVLHITLKSMCSMDTSVSEIVV